jgi:hypothetical protein
VFTARYVNTITVTLIYTDRVQLRNVCRFHFVLRPQEQEVQDGSITVTTDRKSELENVSCLRNGRGGGGGATGLYTCGFLRVSIVQFTTSLAYRVAVCHHHHHIRHGVGPLVDPFRSHVSRSLFKVLPWFLLPVEEYCFITLGNLLRGILFTCCIQLQCVLPGMLRKLSLTRQFPHLHCRLALQTGATEFTWTMSATKAVWDFSWSCLLKPPYIHQHSISFSVLILRQGKHLCYAAGWLQRC